MTQAERAHREDKEEYRENGKRALFVSVYWNEFGGLNLGTAARVEVKKLSQQK
jgi:hypothetical protein